VTVAIALGSLVQQALRTAAQVGVAGSATITRPAGTVINPTTGATSGSSLTQTCTAVQLRPQAYRLRGGAWSEAAGAIAVAADDLAFTPVVADRVTFAGTTHTVTAVETLAPRGAAVLLELALGAA
jgi:hypothetical protein